MINFDNINLEEFFGCVDATNTPQMKSNTFKTIRTWLQENSFAKWSNGQVDYVGDYMDGVDFKSAEHNYEMKGTLGMFNKNGTTKSVVLKNFRGDVSFVDRTFDYMLLVDTKNMSIAVTDWETVEKRTYYTPSSPCAKFKLEPGDYTMLAEHVTPSTKNTTADVLLNNFQDIL